MLRQQKEVLGKMEEKRQKKLEVAQEKEAK